MGRRASCHSLHAIASRGQYLFLWYCTYSWVFIYLCTFSQPFEIRAVQQCASAEVLQCCTAAVPRKFPAHFFWPWPPTNR
jgi:hypothetical protein